MFSRLLIIGLMISFILGSLAFNLAYYFTFNHVSEAWLSLVIVGGVSFSLSFIAALILKKTLDRLNSNRTEI